MKRRTIFVILSFIVTLCVSACLIGCGNNENNNNSNGSWDDNNENGQTVIEDSRFGYILSAGEDYYTLSQFNNANYQEIVIPSTYKELPVKAIGENVFASCKSLQAVVIPDSIEIIGDGAFLGCTSLGSINISNNISKIGARAFLNCESLTKLTIGENVSEIGSGAFSGCISLTEIKYNAINCADFNEYDYVFSNAGKNSNELSILIGQKVNKVPDWFFSGNVVATKYANVTSVTFENNSNCSIIGNHAFEYCKSLSKLSLPARLNTQQRKYQRFTSRN